MARILFRELSLSLEHATSRVSHRPGEHRRSLNICLYIPELADDVPVEFPFAMIRTRSGRDFVLSRLTDSSLRRAAVLVLKLQLANLAQSITATTTGWVFVE